MPQKPLIPDPDGRQIAYSRVAAVMLAIRLLNDAAEALLTGHPMKKTKTTPHKPHRRRSDRPKPPDHNKGARGLRAHQHKQRIKRTAFRHATPANETPSERNKK